MRILHTSDWHLGAEFAQRSRHTEHAAFLDWLLATLEREAVDALIVAGDVFDAMSPPAEALTLYYRFLARLAALPRRPTAIIVGGNHDSASRLDAPRTVLAALDTHVVGGYAPERIPDPSGDPSADPTADPAGRLVPLRGPDGAVALVVAAVPYLNDWRLGVRGFDGSPDEQRQSLRDAFRDVYTRLADKASAAFPGAPLLATGHLTCLPQAGARTTPEDAVPVDINRVGTLGALGPDVFDPRYAYVALGHIHRALPVDPARRVWYCGTPVQVSPDEPADSRRVHLVDLSPAGATVTPLAVPITRRLLRLRGPVDRVRAALDALRWPDTELPPYVVAEATVTAPDHGLRDELRQRAPTGPGGQAQVVDVRALLARDPDAPGASPLDALPTGDAVTPEEAFRYAWRARHGEDATPPDAILQRFRHLLEHAGPTDTPTRP